MKKFLKGFTLVECIVAAAILAIASLTMAQIYANVAQRNKENHFMNSSLSNQMAYIEKYTNSGRISVYFGNNASQKDSALNAAATLYPPHKQGITDNLGTSAYVQIESSYAHSTDPYGSGTGTAKGAYSYAADIHVMYSRDTKDKGSDDADYSPIFSEENDNLRYKYILGHNNS